MLFNPLEGQNKATIYTPQFRGMNHSESCQDGQLYDMENLTGDLYPLLSPRSPRVKRYKVSGEIVAMLDKPGVGLLTLSAEDGWLCLDKDGYQVRIPQIEDMSAQGMRASLVSMGAYIIIFPAGIYSDTAEWDSYGGNATWQFIDAQFSPFTVECTPCDREGNELQNCTWGDSAPSNPNDGDIWMDTSGDTVVGNRWSSSTRMWVVLSNIYTRIDALGIGADFKAGDGVMFDGATGLNSKWQILEKVEMDYVVVTAVWEYPQEFLDGDWIMVRRMPALQYVTECDNRLWGCTWSRQMQEDGSFKLVNEIYACALGDFTNWNKFQGIATDSYAASRGSDGPWTGAITYNGHPMFFKENSIDTVYVSSSGAHEIVSNQCRGVQKQLPQSSLAVVDEMLFYCTGTEVCRYDGTQPVSVSGALGRFNALGSMAWGYNHKYYVFLETDPEDEGSIRSGLYTFDVRSGLWHREDRPEAFTMAGDGRHLYYGDVEGWVWQVDGTQGTPEGEVDWMAETGDMGLISTRYASRAPFSTGSQGYTTRFVIRLAMPRTSSVDLYIQYDSTGIWEHKGHFTCGPWLQSLLIPVLPRRCDHLRFRLKGHGPCKIYSISREQEGGSDIT